MAPQFIFTMQDVRKVHPPSKEVLKGLWLSFYPGAKIGVLGVNGSGKSTLLRIMAGVDKDYMGEAKAADGVPEDFWVVVAGGKYDFTAKWWDPDSFQAVVDHFRGRLTFVQCGEAGHWHPRLRGAIDLVGRTTTREFVLLVHHAAGVLCPVTFAMHLAAAVEARPGRPRHTRPPKPAATATL